MEQLPTCMPVCCGKRSASTPARMAGSRLRCSTRRRALWPTTPHVASRAAHEPAGQDVRRLGQGECVDCTLCVQVCPTGIDIRNGLQAACISCGLCIDACDAVMDKIGSPRGLIRFAPMDGAAAAAAWRRPRVWVYAALLLVVATALGVGWALRPELRLDVLRDRSVLAREVEDGAVENVYRLQLINASLESRELSVHAFVEGSGTPLAAQATHPLRVEPARTGSAVIALRMEAAAAQAAAPSRVLPVRIELRDAAAHVFATSGSTFLLR